MVSNPVTISMGDLQQATTAQLQRNQANILTYLAIFIPATGIASYLDVMLGLIQTTPDQMYQRQYGAIGLLVLIASTIFQYRLFATMLDRPIDSGKYAAFIGLAILTFLGVGLATLLLIVPGIIVGARWLMSPAIFTAEGTGVTEAMKQSWARTKGNTKPVIFAVLLFILVVIVASSILGVLSGFISFVPLLPDLLNAVVGEVVTVVLIAMSVALYNLIGGSREELQSVFE